MTEPATLTLAAGHQAWLAAQANDTAGQPIGGAIFRFTPTDARILKVSDKGLVTSLGPVSTRSAVIVASGRDEQRVPVVVLPGAPQRVDKISGDGQQPRAGEAPVEPLAIRVTDRWNNPLGGISLTAESPAHLFPPGEVVSGRDGLADFRVPALTRAGPVTVLFRSPAAEDLSASFTLRVTPGPAAEIDRVPPSGADLSTQNPASVTLQVRDGYGNPVPDIALTAHTSRGDTAPLQARTDAAGKLTWVIPHKPSMRRADLEVQVADSPTIHRTFALTFDSPRAPHKGHPSR